MNLIEVFFIKAVASLLKSVTDKYFNSLEKKITNPDLLKLAQDAQAGIDDFFTAAEAF